MFTGLYITRDKLMNMCLDIISVTMHRLRAMHITFVVAFAFFMSIRLPFLPSSRSVPPILVYHVILIRAGVSTTLIVVVRVFFHFSLEGLKKQCLKNRATCIMFNNKPKKSFDLQFRDKL